MELSVLCKVLVRKAACPKPQTPYRPCFAKTLLIMKLTSFLLLVMSLHLGARGVSQRVTISGNDLSLEQVFKQIGKQTGYMFLYEKNVLQQSKKVDVDLRNVPLVQALEECFRNQPLEFAIMQNNVLVKVKPEKKIREEAFLFVPVVTGKVTNEKGEGLAGVAVQIKGTGKGTVTNERGEFVLRNVDNNAILIFSMVGYKKQELNVGGRASLTIQMEVEIADLESVSVSTISTGYKQIPKYQLTGAASVVSAKVYDQRVAVTGNFLESLEGKVPGLVYNSQSGELSIRGVSTFDAVKQPLIVVDGFPTEIDIRTINPIDIVSISVLRDAAAAAIYGVRASNGVIVIETKRGKSGKPVFSLRATTAFEPAPDFGYLKYITAREFVQLQKDEFLIGNPSETIYTLSNYAKNPALAILFDRKANRITQEEADKRLEALASYDNAEEYKRLFYQNRQARNINFDVSGGNERNTYVLGMNYVGETPVNRRSENQRFILNMANTFRFSQRVKFEFRGLYTNSTSKNGNTPAYTDFYPYERLADESGNPLPVALGPNREYLRSAVTKQRNDRLIEAGLYDQFYYPYRELYANTNTLKYSNVRFQGRIDAKITNWLNFEIGGAYENQQGVADTLQEEEAFMVRWMLNSKALRDGGTGRPLFVNLPQGDVLKRANLRTEAYTLRAQFNFNHSFRGGLHEVSGIAGIEQRKTINAGYKTTYFGYDGQSLLAKPVNLQVLNTSSRPAFTDVGRIGYNFRSTEYFSESHADRRFMSYYGQGTYVYAQKYIATGSFRIDQSNLFGVDPKYRNKPLWSAGLSWRMNKEDFLRQYSWINEVKLRAATGFNGNVPSSNNGPFLILQSGVNVVFQSAQQFNDVLSPENQSLRWETTRNYNLGIDYSFFNNRFYGSVDWYLKRSEDVFGQFDADPTTGFNQYNANTATISNKGLEFIFGTINVKSHRFEWRTQLTASFNQNKVIKVKATEYETSDRIVTSEINREGYPMGALFSYNYGGLTDLGKPFVYDSKGNRKILDFYGSEVIDVSFEDLIYNGTTTPKYVLGLNNNLTLGNFDLSFLFMYYGGHVMRVEQPNPDNLGSYSTPPIQGSTNFWRKPGDEANTIVPGFSPGTTLAPGYFSTYARYGYEYASRFVRKADYIRLRDVILTYNAQMPFLKKIGLSGTQLRLQVQNAFRYTFSGNDIDPDATNRITGVRRLPQQPFYSFSLFTNF